MGNEITVGGTEEARQTLDLYKTQTVLLGKRFVRIVWNGQFYVDSVDVLSTLKSGLTPIFKTPVMMMMMVMMMMIIIIISKPNVIKYVQCNC